MKDNLELAVEIVTALATNSNYSPNNMVDKLAEAIEIIYKKLNDLEPDRFII